MDRPIALLIFLTFLCSLSVLSSQDCYTQFYQEGVKAYNTLNFEKALSQFQAAAICEDKPDKNDLSEWISKTKDGYINEILKARKEAEDNLRKAEKLIKGFHFYKDQYALIVNAGKYYFINKNGDFVNKLKVWNRAEQFDRYGYAKVLKVEADTTISFDTLTYEENIIISNRRDSEFLLDTMGNQYRLGSSSAPINSIVEALDLSEKQLGSIEAIFSSENELKIIILDKNNLLKLPDNFFLNTPLEKVYLTGNQIKQFPPISENHPLKYLNASLNQLEFLPADINHFTNLVSLELRLNKLQTLPPQIGGLKNLQYLNLFRNELTFLPKEIGELSNLEFLDLGSNKLTNIPPEIGNLKSLKKLILSNNKLTFLPKEIGKLKELESLSINSTELQELPEEIRALNKLEKLSLSSNSKLDFTKVFDDLTSFDHLSILNLNSNDLTLIPPSISEMKNLKELWLYNNQIKNLPWEIEKLSNLNHLSLSHNQIQGFPSVILNLKALRHLNLSNNKIVAIPKDISQLSQLEVLNLRATSLTELPQEIGNLKKLKNLDLSNNNISKLPDELKNLKNLEQLLLDQTFSDAEIADIKKHLPHCIIFLRNKDNNRLIRQ